MIPVNLNRLTDEYRQDKLLKNDLEPEYIIKKSFINSIVSAI